MRTASSVLAGTLLAFLRPDVPAKVSHRTVTFAERVSYQRAIEEVYWRQNVIIAGFITNGSTQVLVRGLGPARAQFGVSEALADPVLTLVDGNGNVVQSNNNWKDTQQAAIQATGFAPPNDLEAAILAPVAAGNYTAILSGNGGGTGIGLIEVYK